MNTLHTPALFLDHFITEVRLVSDSTTSHFLTPQKIKISFGSQLPEPPDSWHHCRPTLLSWNSSPALHHIPSLWFSSYFSHYYSTVLFMAKLPSPICPGGVCLDSPTSFVLSLFTAPGEVTFSQMGYINFEAYCKTKVQGPFLNNDYTFQDGTGRVWVSSRGLWQLCKLHVREAGPVFNSRTWSAQCFPGLCFQPRPLSWALGLNTILYDDHSLFDHQSPPGRFWFTPDSFTHQLCNVGQDTHPLWTAVSQCKIRKSMWKLVQVSR